MINIILSGGSGTRLWPISRTLLPKQYNKIIDNESLFQKTAKRNNTLCSSRLVITNQEQYFMAQDQIEEIAMGHTQFLLEPVGRNTAPAIALACMSLEYDDIVLVTPSDHLIKNEDEYEKVLKKAKEFAEKDHLVTFGIKPTHPETGYGYIEADQFNVKSFKEKPDEKTAKSYIKEGNYYWNSGIFCFKAGVFLEELTRYSPEISEACQVAFKTVKEKSPYRVGLEEMMNIPEDSIDYAVMEKSDKVKVVPSDIGWSDLGSFDSLYDELPKDKDSNTEADNTIHIGSSNNLLMSSERLIATIDVEDLIIVDTPDALLVSKRGSSQKVREVVKELKQRNTELHNIHMTAHRPWGTYTILEESDQYKIKRIVVKPGKRLSLQKHYHRSEHWTVVSGTAIVQLDDEERLVRTNESTYIPKGTLHRLTNPGKIDLVLIEAQVGEYLGEDDIVRVEDDFKRS